MVRYLTAEWLDALDAAAAADDGLRLATAGLDLTVQQVVTASPDGDVSFHVEVRDGRVRFRAGAADAPTVTFTQSYETAVEVARGELSAQGTFMTGRIRVAGDLPRLVQDGDAFAGIDDVFAHVREQTTY